MAFQLQSIYSNNLLNKADRSVELKTKFPKSRIGRQLAMVSKMIASRDCRGSNRDIFYVETGKFDHHADVIPNLEVQFETLNEGLASFVSEMKSLPNDVWDDIVVVVSSDFGRYVYFFIFYVFLVLPPLPFSKLSLLLSRYKEHYLETLTEDRIMHGVEIVSYLVEVSMGGKS